MERTQSGFTLIELLVAVAVLSVLVGIALPAWSAARASAEAAEARTLLLSSLTTMVQKASTISTNAILCPADVTGHCQDTTDWSRGWVGFPDANGNFRRDPEEVPFVSSGPLGTSARLRTTIGRTRLVFQPGGGNAGSNVTFTLCDDRGPASAVNLVLANDGRMRADRATPASYARCFAG